MTTIISIVRIGLLGSLIAFAARRPQLAFFSLSLPGGGQGEGPNEPTIRKAFENHAGTRAAFEPAVRVLIPAFNEAKVLSRTLDALMQSDYPYLRVSIIDDGSTDNTAAVAEWWSDLDARISLIQKLNGGKASALNAGMAAASEEYVITIDADTIILPHSVRRLIERFADPAVDAVCGNVQVGNVRNMLTAFQNVEYITSQNYDRRAFDSLNCISVVPGATGAWNRRKVLAVGGYSTQTLTEDADLTLTLLAAGGRIVYAPEAQSVTEAPETARTLFRQRFRWSFGTLQCLWKHRRQFGHGTLGNVALVNILLFQLIFPLLSPLGDAVMVMCLLRRSFGALAAGYLLFLLMDCVSSLIAFRLDRRSYHGAWVVLVQRFYYRQFMYVVTIAALLAALRGRRHGWNKLSRTGTVRMPKPSIPHPISIPSRTPAPTFQPAA
jgi:peptidoglycan-N-acetylglucosamine deacetylase